MFIKKRLRNKKRKIKNKELIKIEQTKMTLKLQKEMYEKHIEFTNMEIKMCEEYYAKRDFSKVLEMDIVAKAEGNTRYFELKHEVGVVLGGLDKLNKKRIETEIALKQIKGSIEQQNSKNPDGTLKQTDRKREKKIAQIKNNAANQKKAEDFVVKTNDEIKAEKGE